MRIVSANLYVGSKQKIKDARKLANLNAVAYGLQEAHRGTDELMKVIGDTHNVYMAASAGKSGREVPVLLAKRAKFLGKGAYLVSNRLRRNNTGIAPDRFLTWVRFQFKGQKYALLNMHPNAAVQSRKTGRPLSSRIRRVREYIKSMTALDKEIKRQKRDGYFVIVTGDLNYRINRRVAIWKWSPAGVFRRNGMKFYAEGLDYMAWDKRIKRNKTFVVPTTQTGSDHPWIVTDFAT